PRSLSNFRENFPSSTIIEEANQRLYLATTVRVSTYKMKVIPLNEGLAILEEAIVKAGKVMEGCPEMHFTANEYMKYYECVYHMAIQREPCEYTAQLYERYRTALEDSINAKVLPCLLYHDGMPLLTDLVKAWSAYKVMSNWLAKFFGYLDRFYTARKDLLPLRAVATQCFRRLALQEELFQKILHVLFSMIDYERDGNQIDSVLVKHVMDLLVECGMEFEQAMLAHTAAYYSRKSSEWIAEDSCNDYIMKADWCLNQERGRICRYLDCTKWEPLLQVAKYQLIDETVNKLREKQLVEPLSTANFQILVVGN
ncbi:hypothetical protein GIB67_006918, partial [Kingdonia uniflora]